MLYCASWWQSASSTSVTLLFCTVQSFPEWMRNFITELYDYCPHISTQYSNVPRRSCSSCCVCNVVSYFYVAAAELLWAQSAWCSGASQPDKYHNRHWNLRILTQLDCTLFCPTSNIFLFLLWIFVLHTIRRYATEQIAPTLSMSLLSPVWSLHSVKTGSSCTHSQPAK